MSDPRWALASVLLSSLLIASLQRLPTAAAAFGLALIASALAKVSIKKLFLRLGLIALSLLPLVAALPFIQDDGLTLAFTIILKAFAIGTLVDAFAASGPAERLWRAARSLGVPGPLVQIAMLAHRYSHTLFDEVRRLRIAWRVRGFQPATSLRTYRTYAHGFGAVLVRSGERGERVSAAMKARGFDGTFRSAQPFDSKPGTILACTALTGLFLSFALWDRLA